MQLLVQLGANINSQDGSGCTPLHRAQTLEICESLIDRGADLSIRDKWRRTPVFSLNRAKVQLLLRRGAEINIKDNNGHTPPMWVVYKRELFMREQQDKGRRDFREDS